MTIAEYRAAVLRYVAAVKPGAITSTAVAQAVGIATSTAADRLRELEERGHVRRTPDGGWASNVWPGNVTDAMGV